MVGAPYRGGYLPTAHNIDLNVLRYLGQLVLRAKVMFVQRPVETYVDHRGKEDVLGNWAKAAILDRSPLNQCQLL